MSQRLSLAYSQRGFACQLESSSTDFSQLPAHNPIQRQDAFRMVPLPWWYQITYTTIRSIFYWLLLVVLQPSSGYQILYQHYLYMFNSPSEFSWLKSLSESELARAWSSPCWTSFADMKMSTVDVLTQMNGIGLGSEQEAYLTLSYGGDEPLRHGTAVCKIDG